MIEAWNMNHMGQSSILQPPAAPCLLAPTPTSQPIKPPLHLHGHLIRNTCLDALSMKHSSKIPSVDVLVPPLRRTDSATARDRGIRNFRPVSLSKRHI